MQIRIILCLTAQTNLDQLRVSALNNFGRAKVPLIVRVRVELCSLWCFQTGKILREGWSRDSAVVRALASHQCGSGSIPGLGVIRGLNLMLVLVLAPRGFSPGTPVFPSPIYMLKRRDLCG